MIHLLREETIQKIAAGEVIERPASVVKELVENSIDAGAHSIRVEIRRGGKERIRVTDDGAGIPANEMETAFLRHATSKIDDFADLYRLHSMGFRGEALASIVAVADVRIVSRTQAEAVGTQMLFSGGARTSTRSIATPVGTILEVSDLFGNVPVRRNFLKSDATEANRISALLYSLAIGHPDISMQFWKEDRRVFQTDRRRSAAENLLLLFGSDYYDALIAVEGKNEVFTLHGFLSDNTYYRGNRQMQYLYVNGRFVEEDAIVHTVEDAYRTVIPNGRYPAFQLFIETDPANVDINIHPNKQKVRFRDSASLQALLRTRVPAALREHTIIPKITAQTERPAATAGVEKIWDLNAEGSYQALLEKLHPQRDTTPVSETALRKTLETLHRQTAQTSTEFPETGEAAVWHDLEEMEDTGESPSIRVSSWEGVEVSSDAPVSPDAGLAPTQQLSALHTEETPEEDLLPSGLPRPERLHYLGTLFDTYLLCEWPERQILFVVDQHAAHERINLERFEKQYAARKIVQQRLALPIPMQLDDNAMQRYTEREALLRDMGYDVERFGADTVVLRAVPALFHATEERQAFLELIDLDSSRHEKPASLRNALAMAACKASIRQGDRLSVPEVQALLQDLFTREYPYTCAHGRPTFLKLRKTELEKMFFRIQT